jgi:hypothetical protein
LPALREAAQHQALDACIDRLLAGKTWADVLPADDNDRTEITGLMAVARRLFDFGHQLPEPEREKRRQVWNRVNRGRGIVRRVAFYRFPYLPPLWIRPKAC